MDGSISIKNSNIGNHMDGSISIKNSNIGNQHRLPIYQTQVEKEKKKKGKKDNILVHSVLYRVCV